MCPMISVIGEALVDLVVLPDGRVDAALGGAPFNVARAAARLDASVSFTGGLSVDRFGRLLDGALREDGVAVTAPPVEAPTTLALAEIDASGSASYRFYLDGTAAPLGDAAAASVDGDRPGVVVTGGLGLVLEPMATSIERLLVDLATTRPAHRPLVVVAVNARPAVVNDLGLFRTRVHTVVAASDLVKVSDEDLAVLSPGDEPADAAAALLDLGAAAVILTAGAAASTVFVGDERRDVSPGRLPGAVVDTIGAGDTFLGASVAWLTRHDAHLDRTALSLDAVAEAVAVGHAAAGVVVTRRGADPPTRADLGDAWPNADRQTG